MSAPETRWHLPPLPPEDTGLLARELDLPELLVRLLRTRGYRTATAIREFLEPTGAQLHRPSALPDIEPATRRVCAAIRNRERILVCGDYDVDGVTGTALLVSVLRRLGADVASYLPHRRTEGYGFSAQAVEFARAGKVGLVITNDCGISDHDRVAACNESAIDVVITDHHEPGPTLPPALAVVNPRRADSGYPFSELAGVGVAFKLAWSVLAALDRPKEELTSLFDLVALGTIADVVSLTGENRVISRLGLGAICRSPRPGIRALIEVARLNPARLSGRDVGFGLAPRINAAGRVGHARQALDLLLTEDEAEARRLAAELDSLNRDRQQLEENARTEALAAIEAEDLARQRVLVVAGPGWHEGVIGIVAARLVEQFHRPCIVVTLEDGRGRGSGRSVGGFDLYAALRTCSGLLLGFGGHRYAAGLTVDPARLPALRDALNRHAAACPPDIFEPSLQVAALADINDINERLAAAIGRLEPFGPDNPEPVFASLGLEVVGCPRCIGRDSRHLKFKVRNASGAVEAVAWSRGADIATLRTGRPGSLDLCYTVKLDDFNGRRRVLLDVLDMRPHAPEKPRPA